MIFYTKSQSNLGNARSSRIGLPPLTETYAIIMLTAMAIMASLLKSLTRKAWRRWSRTSSEWQLAFCDGLRVAATYQMASMNNLSEKTRFTLLSGSSASKNGKSFRIQKHWRHASFNYPISIGPPSSPRWNTWKYTRLLSTILIISRSLVLLCFMLA